MNDSRIIIYSNEFDGHADIVIRLMNERGIEPIRLNSDDINSGVDLYCGITDNRQQVRIHIKGGDRWIDTASIRSFWWRKPMSYSFSDVLSDEEKRFAEKETGLAYQGIWSLLDCYWIGFPDNLRSSSRKVEQLSRAKRYGFFIPETIVTTSPEEVRHFYYKHNGNIIYKVLGNPILDGPEDEKVKEYVKKETYRAVLTTPITDSNLGSVDSVRYAPCLFQNYIPKAFELRVTVIGNKVFAARIDSQSNEATKVDFRDWSVNIPYSRYELTSIFEQKILKFVKSYNLNFSALDFIMTPDQELVFLENNPNGQFLWIEDLVPELKMADHLIDCLISGRNL